MRIQVEKPPAVSTTPMGRTVVSAFEALPPNQQHKVAVRLKLGNALAYYARGFFYSMAAAVTAFPPLTTVVHAINRNDPAIVMDSSLKQVGNPALLGLAVVAYRRMGKKTPVQIAVGQCANNMAAQSIGDGKLEPWQVDALPRGKRRRLLRLILARREKIPAKNFAEPS